MAYGKKQVIKAIDGSGGFVTTVARRLGCTTQTIYNLRKKHEEIEAAFQEEKTKQIDFVEAKLQEQIKDGNTTAIIFYLKTQGKSRGYVERQEITGMEGAPVTINFIPARERE